MFARKSSPPVWVLALASLWPLSSVHADTPADLVARLESAIVDEDEKAAQQYWKQLAPAFDQLSPLDQGRFLVAQGLIQEDILRDIDSADQSFNRVIALLDQAAPSLALADAYYERAYIKYIRTNDTAVYCPDREKAVALGRQLNARARLAKFLTALSFCYSDSPRNLQKGLAVLDEAVTLAESLQLKPADRGLIYNATAILYRKNQLYQQAYDYSRLAYDQWKSIDALPSIDNQLHNLLTNAIGMGDLDKAERHGKEMFELADQAPQYKDFRFFAALDSGLVAFAKNDLPRAIALFEQAKREEPNTEETAFIIANRAQLAGAYFLHGDIDAALREAAALGQLPGYQALDADQKQFVQALQQYSGKRPVQALQTLYSLYRAQQKRQWEFLANNTLDHALRHNTRIQEYERQLLELRLDAQQRKQEASRLYLALVLVIALSLAALASTLWRSRRRFRTQAQTDSLTGIANRRHFLDCAQQVARKSRHPPQTASVLVLDIDYFKLINDAHGHQAGDAAIRHVANHASACLRAGDVFGRIGGEEFAALLPATDDAEAWKVAERIRQVIEQTPLNHQGDEIFVTVSIGLTTGPLSIDNIENLMQRADKVMYRAKNAGRNRSFTYSDHEADITAASKAVG